MPFGLRTRVGSRNHVLDGSPDRPMQRGNFLGEKHARACTALCCKLSKNGWTDRNAVWVVDSGGPKEACVTWGCTLAPPGEYGWTVHMCGGATARRSSQVLSTTVASLLHRLLTFVETMSVTQRVARFIWATAETCIFYDSPQRKQFECISAHNVRSVTVMRPPASSILYEMARIMQESTPGAAVIRYVVYVYPETTPRVELATPRPLVQETQLLQTVMLTRTGPTRSRTRTYLQGQGSGQGLDLRYPLTILSRK